MNSQGLQFLYMTASRTDSSGEFWKPVTIFMCIKIAFTKNLGADYIWVIVVTIRLRIFFFVLPPAMQNCWCRERTSSSSTNYDIACCVHCCDTLSLILKQHDCILCFGVFCCKFRSSSSPSNIRNCECSTMGSHNPLSESVFETRVMMGT